jgi:hypothetical protein
MLGSRMLCAMLTAFFLSACSGYRPRAARPLSVYNSQVNAELAGNWLAAYDALTDQTAKLNQRNHLLSEFVWAVDRNYDRFEVAFYTNKAAEDIAGDFIGLGLGGASVFTGSAHAKTILSVVAATVIGAKASIDSRWYNQETREAIVSEMRALRSTQLAVIEKGMGEPLSSYSLDEGILDVQEYYQEGSIVAALQAISQTASGQAVAAKAALSQMRK